MKRLILTLAAVLLASGCNQDPGPLTVSTDSVPLFPDDPGRRNLDQLTYQGGIEISSETPGFGGWSAIEISPDGERLLAISDGGAWLTATLEYNRNGHLDGLSHPRMAPLRDARGEPLEGPAGDAEGLAPLGGGRYAVSFERDHRIQVYDIGEDWSGIDAALPEPYTAPPGLNRLRDNGGIEALAPAENGLWAGIEHPAVDGQPHTIWHLGDGDAVPHSMHLSDGFGLTALARAAPGELIAVERYWSRSTGNRIRLTRIADSALEASAAGGPGLGPDLLGELDTSMTVDNFEGAAIAEVNGEPHLFLISDDNFNAEQRTLLLSFSLRSGDG
ncbi:hypothetical protein GCM10011367_20400 [Marinicauda pacifica]|uniref:Phytase-like domain-containing protein n=1 Tax=Marinicauda pacifica TaxID=1133559 RepID=A0A4S2H889_9PROT|nr:esterase-like activity of phytase family protein [Marinicauda pacifica]TGY92047.1 hypothetical protein E5162_10280 [Marinicauda pacifica]GGE45515.1 hypothetical protein GCM10011367_20400 [Marinicauda pacifica]